MFNLKTVTHKNTSQCTSVKNYTFIKIKKYLLRKSAVTYVIQKICKILRQQPLNKNWHHMLGETSKICGLLINHILFQTVANTQLEEHQNINFILETHKI